MRRLTHLWPAQARNSPVKLRRLLLPQSQNAYQEPRIVSEHTPAIDFENLPAPSDGFLVTLFITVRSVARSRGFYSDVLGGQVVLEKNPCVIKLSTRGAT
jgi:hypothetical protein